MKILGFVICNKRLQWSLHTEGKIYPYYSIDNQNVHIKFPPVKIRNDNGYLNWVIPGYCYNSSFAIFHPPEFPQDINQWTENDWFNFSLKYG